MGAAVPGQRHRQPRNQSQWGRYVAIGDSSTEGLDDPDGSGGFRGWADRLAEHIAAAQGQLEYANLAIRGKTTAQILAEQVPAALELKPDLVSVVAGMNDILNPTFHAATTAAEVEGIFRTFIAAGATVLTLTLPDPTPNLPLARVTGPRLVAFNQEMRAAADRAGALMVDVASYVDCSDPRLWSDDRLHGNSEGHALVARALAHGLGLPGFDASWLDPMPPTEAAAAGLARIAAVRADLLWAQNYGVPFLWRTVRGRSAGDGREAKRPSPLPLPGLRQGRS